MNINFVIDNQLPTRVAVTSLKIAYHKLSFRTYGTSLMPQSVRTIKETPLLRCVIRLRPVAGQIVYVYDCMCRVCSA